MRQLLLAGAMLLGIISPAAANPDSAICQARNVTLHALIATSEEFNGAVDDTPKTETTLMLQNLHTAYVAAIAVADAWDAYINYGCPVKGDAAGMAHSKAAIIHLISMLKTRITNYETIDMGEKFLKKIDEDEKHNKDQQPQQLNANQIKAGCSIMSFGLWCPSPGTKNAGSVLSGR